VTEATSHIHIIPRTDVVLKRSWGSLELRLYRSGIFKHNFIYVLRNAKMLAYETEVLATEAETKAFIVETEAKTKTFSLEAEARWRRLKFQPRRD